MNDKTALAMQHVRCSGTDRTFWPDGSEIKQLETITRGGPG